MNHTADAVLDLSSSKLVARNSRSKSDSLQWEEDSSAQTRGASVVVSKHLSDTAKNTTCHSIILTFLSCILEVGHRLHLSLKCMQ
jgi:hypothetical protein